MVRLIRITAGLLVAFVGASIGYVLSDIVTAAWPFNGAVAAMAFAVLCRWVGGVSWRVSLAAAGTLVMVSFAPLVFRRTGVPMSPDAQRQVLQALTRTAIPLRSVDPIPDSDDLAPLGSILGGRRIVAMGEATHGTSEFFRMKHRIAEYLVVKHGFRDYAMEVNEGDGKRLNAFIHGADENPGRILYWPWATEEVVAMLRWMREYNARAAPEDRIRFHGIDPRSGDRDAVMAANASAVLRRLPGAKLIIWAHNAHISGAPGAMGFHLKREFSDSVYRIGFEFDHGSWTSRTLAVHTFDTPPASAEFYASDLAKLPSPVLFLDFGTMHNDETALSWLNAPRSSHEFQELHLVYRHVPSWHTLSIPWPELYDGVMFIRTSTPARVLSGR